MAKHVHPAALLAPLCLLLLSPAAARAAEADPDFSPDRPGYADGTAVVPELRLQTEAGVTASFYDGAREISVPDLLLRFGLTGWLEARLAAPTLVFAKIDGLGSDHGFGDLGLGLKVARAFGDSFSTSLVAGASLPTGQDGFSSEGVDPEVELNVAFDATDRLSLGANAKYAYATDPGEGEISGSLSLGVGIVEGLGAFAEAIVVKPSSEDTALGAGAGATYMVTPRTQIDASFTADLHGIYFGKTVGGGVAVLW